MTLGLSSKRRIIIGSVLFLVLVGTLFYFQGKFHVASVVSFFEWLDGLGAWAPFLFILAEMVVVVFILPGFGLILALGGGFMFGVLKGALYIVIGTNLGAAFAFMIARHFFGERASRFILTHSKLKLLNDELSREGWKIVLLTNLVPFFPFKLSHYFFGLTGFSLRDLFIGVFFGIMPITITNAYIGSLASDLSTLGLRSSSRSQADWVIYGIGLVIMIGVVVYITRLALRALDKYVSREEPP
ncbi:MAG: TVP38/TMEM64 family protein [Deltaproteobacteria bacterium]|nr:TVP38/TMEM64 family protein [Deltaproteobacteria bacterium]